jgi:hypothetical protein
MTQKLIKTKTIPFRGGVITNQELSLIPSGGYSAIQNMRMRHPGFEKRTGCRKLHTTADKTGETGNEVVTLFQFSKGRVAEKHFYAQMGDGDVLEATTAPPGVKTGAFGSGTDIFSGTTGQVPASWSVNNDVMVYSNGVDQHQIYPGSDQYVKRVVVFVSAAAIPTIPDIGKDYTEQATDVQTSTVVTLNDLSLLDDYDCVFILTDIPATSLKLTISAVNGNVAKGQLHYWNGAWTAPSGFADGTSVPTAAATYENAFAETTGWTDVDSTSSIVGSGQSGNCISIAESGGANPGKTYHDITTVISQVYRLTYWFKKGTSSTGKVMIGTTADEDSLSAGTAHSDANWTKYEIEFTPAATTTRITLQSDDATAGETSLFDTLSVVTGKTLAQTGSLSWTMPTDEIPHYMYNECGFWYRYSLSHGVLDAAVSVSSIQYNTAWQSIQNVWDGIPIQPTEVSVYDYSATIPAYYTYGAAQVTFSLGTTSDFVYFNSPDPIVGFYIDVGKTPNLTQSTTINAVNYFNGSAFAAVSNLYDGTDGLSKSGWVTFGRQSLVQPRQFNDSRYYSYWYQFTVDQTLSATVQFSIELMPYFNINEFGYEGLCNCAWKDRMLYVFSRFPNDIVVSGKHRPMVLNGYDFTILDRPGDGRANKVVCIKKIYNELLVWQEEKGVDGGCLTLYQGYSPETFGKLVVSTRYGTFNAKSAVVVDGIRMNINKIEDPPVSVAFFLSHAGVFMCDGKTIECISDQPESSIQNYFDPKSSVCITYGCESKMWLVHDPSENCIRIGLVSGSAGTVANVFPVYDIGDRAWSFDVLSQPFSCMANVEADTGAAVTAVQVAGGTVDGFVYQSNYGTDDISGTGINAFATMEVDSAGKRFVLDEIILRMKAQTGNCTLTPSLNGIEQTTKTLSMAAEVTDQVSRRHLSTMNLVSDHISLKFQNSTTAQSIYLKDIGVEIKDYDGQ